MFLEKEITKGAETISYFRNGRDKGTVFCGIINQGNLTGRIMIDPFMAKVTSE